MLEYKNPEAMPTRHHITLWLIRVSTDQWFISVSAYSGDVENNVRRARGYCRMAVDQGAIPIAPHLLFPQFMSEETERELAMFMDIAVLSHCKELWVFGEPTAGMQKEIVYAERKQMTIKYFNKEDT